MGATSAYEECAVVNPRVVENRTPPSVTPEAGLDGADDDIHAPTTLPLDTLDRNREMLQRAMALAEREATIPEVED